MILFFFFFAAFPSLCTPNSHSSNSSCLRKGFHTAMAGIRKENCNRFCLVLVVSSAYILKHVVSLVHPAGSLPRQVHLNDIVGSDQVCVTAGLVFRQTQNILGGKYKGLQVVIPWEFLEALSWDTWRKPRDLGWELLWLMRVLIVCYTDPLCMWFTDKHHGEQVCCLISWRIFCLKNKQESSDKLKMYSRCQLQAYN